MAQESHRNVAPKKNNLTDVPSLLKAGSFLCEVAPITWCRISSNTTVCLAWTTRWAFCAGWTIQFARAGAKRMTNRCFANSSRYNFVQKNTEHRTSVFLKQIAKSKFGTSNLGNSDNLIWYDLTPFDPMWRGDFSCLRGRRGRPRSSCQFWCLSAPSCFFAFSNVGKNGMKWGLHQVS